MGARTRFALIGSVGVLAVAGTAFWAQGAGPPGPTCDERIAAMGAASPPVALTEAQRDRAVAIAGADPIVKELMRGTVLTRRARPFRQPGAFVMDSGYRQPELPGTRAMLVVTLAEPLPAGTYRFRRYEQTFRGGCEADGIASITVQDWEGPPAGATPQRNASHLAIDVILESGRVLSVQPEAPPAAPIKNVGKPEVLYPAR